MTKKLLALLLALVMCLSLAPTVAMAGTCSTIAEVLTTTTFPASGSTAWVCGNNRNKVIYENSGYLTIGSYDGENFNKFECSTDSAVTWGDDDSYSYVTQGHGTIIFNMESDVLMSITLDGGDFDGTYSPVTIENILPEGFPTSNNGAWKNSGNDDVCVYKNEDNFKLVFDNTPFTDGVLISSVLTKAEKDPTWADTTTCRLVYSTDDIVIQFNMTGEYGDKLGNIVVSKCTYGNVVGTYKPPKTVSYIVTYNANGATSGSVPTDSTKYASGASVPVLGNTGTLAKTGYTFDGWNTKADGTGTSYAAGSNFSITENTTLYAKWAHVHNMGTIDATDDIAFEPWISDDSLPNKGGSYYLTKNVTLTTTWSVPNGTTTNLCLNGHVIKMNGSGSVITVPANATLNLYDCNTTTTHDGYVDANGLWHLGTGSGTAKTITGGIITGGTGSWDNNWGGGVYIYGTMNMQGGTIIGNKCNGSDGGGVLVDASDGAGTFNMSSGSIKNNYSSGGKGGGVATANSGTFVMSGGTISDCYALKGGAVGVNSGTFEMTGDAIIKNCEAKISGKDTGWGGAVYLAGGTFTMSGNANISSNTSGADGGGVNIDKGTFEMNGGTITNNVVTGDAAGGAINVGTGTTVTINGGKITGNKAPFGAINVEGNLELYGSEISGNKAQKGNGAVRYNGGSLTIGKTAVVKNNLDGCDADYEGGSACDLWINSGKVITLGSGEYVPRSGMEVGVTMKTPGNFAEASEGDKQYFFADKDNEYVEYKASSLALAALPSGNQKIMVTPCEGGKVIAASYAKKDDTVPVTVTPDEGYKVSTVSYTANGETHLITKNGNAYTFTMPDCAVTISATFEAVTPLTETVYWGVKDGTLYLSANETDIPEDCNKKDKFKPADWAYSYSPWNNNAANTTITAVKIISKIAPTKTAYWFYGLNALSTITDLDKLDTSYVTDMSSMFKYCKTLASLDLSGFDTSNVTNMSSMFESCEKLAELDVRNWDTSKVTDMSYMFQYCKALTELDLSGRNMSKAQNMSYMFYGCESMETLKLDGCTTADATNMSYMFSSCKALTELDLQGFDTSNVTNMSSMFKVTYSSDSKLTTLKLGDNFKTDSVENMNYMFGNCSVLNALDVSKWDTSKVTDMNNMFRSCKALTSLDVSGWNTSKVTNMNSMFYECAALTTLGTNNVKNWNTASVTDMSTMFRDCRQLTALDVSNWNTSNVTKMNWMFGNCSALTELNVSGFDTAKVTDMSYMFSDCSKLITLDVSEWNTSNVTSMYQLFNGCGKLTTLNLSQWNTASVMDMTSMFNNCSGLTELDLRSFNTSKVTSMSTMFKYCSNLKTLDLSSFDASKVTTMKQMFGFDTSTTPMTTIKAPKNIPTTLVSDNQAKLVAGGSMVWFADSTDQAYNYLPATDTSLTLRQGYTITKDSSITNGSVTVQNYAANGDTVTITVTPNSGYRLKADSLKVYKTGESTTTVNTSGSGNTYTFTMPAYAVTVTAAFEEKTPVTIATTAENFTYGETGKTGYKDVSAKVNSQEVSGLATTLVATYYKETATAGAYEPVDVPADAGNYKVVLSVPETNENYTGSTELTFTIAKRPVTLVAGSAEKVYDGNPLTCTTFTVKEDTTTAGYGFIKDEGVASVTMTEGSTISDVGSVDNVIGTPTAKNGTNLNNYVITTEKGTLTVTPAAMTVTATAYEGVYDGEAHMIDWKASNVGASIYLRVEGDKDWISADEFTWYTNATSTDIEVKAELDNYEPAFASATVIITKAPLTVTAKAKSISYGDAAANDGVTYEGFVKGETSMVLGGALAFAYKTQDASPADYTTTSPVGTYDIVPSGLTSDNYEITFTKGTLTVERAKTAVGPTVADSRTYNGTEQNGYTDAGTHVTLGGTATATNAGEYTFTATPDKNHAWEDGSADAKSYAWTIAKATYDMSGVTFDAAENVYDGAAHHPTITGTLPTGADGIQVTVTYSGSQTNVGETDVTATFATTSGNYNTPASMTAKQTVVAKPVTLAWGESRFTYDGSEKAVSVTVEGLVSGDICTATLTGHKATDAGDYYTAEVISLSNGNYTTLPSDVKKAWSIGKAAQDAPAEGVGYTVSGTTLTAKSGYELYNGSDVKNAFTMATGESYSVRKIGDSNHFASPYTAIDTKVTVSVLAVPGNMGTVTGGGSYDIGSNVTVTATAKRDYEFVEWQDMSGTQVGTTASYTIKGITAGQTLIAAFKPKDKVMAALPAVTQDRTYTGSEITGLSGGSGWTLVRGDLSGINAGNYSAVIKLADGYDVWPDGTTADKTVGWNIFKDSQPAPEVTAGENTLTVQPAEGKTAEYRKQGESDYTTVSGKVEATSGTYYVRYRETENYYASPITVVVVSEPTLNVVTLRPSDLSSTGVTFNGVVAPYDAEKVDEVGFEYVSIDRSGIVTASDPISATKDQTFSAQVNDLTEDTDYQVRAYVKCGETTTYGSLVAFHTPKAAPVAQDNGKIKVNATIEGASAKLIVSIERGNDVIASKQSGSATSSYTASFGNLPYGNYNVVVRTNNGHYTETKLLSVVDDNEVTVNFTVPAGKLAAIVEVKTPDTPKTAVDGLGEVLTKEDKDAAANGSKDVEVKLEVEKKAESNAAGAEEIKELLSGNDQILFLDMSLLKTTTELDAVGNATSIDTENIGATNDKVMEIAVPYSDTTKAPKVLRYHNGMAESLTELDARPTAPFMDGTYFVDEGYVFIYASGFSTYAISYVQSTSHGGHGGNTNVISAPTGDAGLALYAALSVSSVLGMGWVGKKKRDEE